MNDIDKNNIRQNQAFELIEGTNVSFFLTGRAGSGKTTFLRRAQEEINKNFIVLAPTGIAAINAGGETIHSFFGFPLPCIFHTLGKKPLIDEWHTPAKAVFSFYDKSLQP